MYLKKGLVLIALTFFILTSATAIASNDGKNGNIVGSVNFTDRIVYFLDHTSSPTEGNWITMESSSEEGRIQLPHPIKLTYCGPKFIEYGGVSGTLCKLQGENYTVTYPSNPTYLSHPVYLPGENVNMSFHGDSCLKGETEVYLLNITSDSAYEIFDVFKAEDIGNLDNLFHSNMDGEYRRYSVALGEGGDILNYSFGSLEPGQYCVVMIQENKDGSLTVVSATAFAVLEHKLRILAPANITEGKDLDISINLENAPDEKNCTYGAVLIKEQAYKANIKINSDGTRNGTSVIINDIDLIDEFDINSSNYRSKLTRDELQTEIQTMIGEGRGSIAIGEKGQRELSLTAFDLPPGYYYLLMGAYAPGKGLVGLAQTELKIKSKDSSENNGSSGNGGNNGGNGNGGNDNEGDDDNGGNNGDNENGGNNNNGGNNGDNENGGNNDNGGGNGGNSKGGSNGGAGGSPEPSRNVKSKELCQQFISNGKQINFKFAQGATSIDYVNFNAKKTVGKITTIVEELKAKSFLALSVPEGEVYKYVNIWIGNDGFADSNNIGNAAVGFKVSKYWITENDIDANSIILQHFSGSDWNRLPTKKLSENEEYILFEAETPGFSPFAITAEKSLTVIEKESGETQVSSEAKTESESDLTSNSDIFSQGNINPGISKIARFFIAFLIVILLGKITMKKHKS
jgi:methanogen extracellular protein (TIGR04279 family)/PGF-pre-PGF domain-containing protein